VAAAPCGCGGVGLHTFSFILLPRALLDSLPSTWMNTRGTWGLGNGNPYGMGLAAADTPLLSRLQHTVCWHDGNQDLVDSITFLWEHAQPVLRKCSPPSCQQAYTAAKHQALMQQFRAVCQYLL
jgi:hypothetical protein